DGSHVAYQVSDDGPLDLLLLPAEFISIDVVEEEPRYRRALECLSSFSRLIRFDRGGVGLSDPLVSPAGDAVARWVDGAVAVLDAVGSTRAAVMGTNEGGLAAIAWQRCARIG